MTTQVAMRVWVERARSIAWGALAIGCALAGCAAGDDGGFAITPGGLVRRECVHAVDDGADIDASALARAGADCDASTSVDPSSGDAGGWIEGVQWLAPQTPTALTSSWKVPPAPKTYHGQTIFLFPAFEPAAEDRIVQPVLQYGPSEAGGGAYWAIASWYLGASTVHSPLLRVAPGDTITGTISTTGSCVGGSCQFTIETADVTLGESRSITVHERERYDEVFPAVLEGYAIERCSDLPAAGSLGFSAVSVTLADHAKPKWEDTVFDETLACGYKVTSTEATATLAW